MYEHMYVYMHVWFIIFLCVGVYVHAYTHVSVGIYSYLCSPVVCGHIHEYQYMYMYVKARDQLQLETLIPQLSVSGIWGLQIWPCWLAFKGFVCLKFPSVG